MQELTIPPQTTAPYTPVGGANTANAPQLGAPVPGSTGGLPAKPGLSVSSNPLPPTLQSAQVAQEQGRGQDSVLVHMTPDEVNSLRGLAQQFGGDLSVNPNTGLPEAGFLGKILPTVLGGLGMAFGIPPIWMGALGAAGGTAATGDLSKGLMMGLGAFGGASLAGGLGLGAKLGTVGADLGLPGAAKLAAQGAGAAATTAAPQMPAGLAQPITGAATQAPPSLALSAPGRVLTNAGFGGAREMAAQVAAQAGAQGAGAAGQGAGFLSKFGQAAGAGLPGGIAQKAAPIAAGLGLLNAATPPVKTYKDKNKPSEYGYTGPYRVAEDRVLQTGPVGTNDVGIATLPGGQMTSREQLYYKPTTSYMDSSGAAWTPGQKTTPITNVGTSTKPRWVYDSQLDEYNQQLKNRKPGLMGSLMGYAEGGEVFHMQSGGHVFPAKAVAAYGDFDTSAGQERLAKMGGIPIRGPGTGVSDSIPATIDGKQPARVASGEVYFPPRAVKRLGGNQKLYAMMRNAERAANKAKSGEKVKGLGAL